MGDHMIHLDMVLCGFTSFGTRVSWRWIHKLPVSPRGSAYGFTNLPSGFVESVAGEQAFFTNLGLAVQQVAPRSCEL